MQVANDSIAPSVDTENIGPPRCDWQTIDTVLLDMDGTLLDLNFDNYFWQQLVPQVYGAARGLNLAAAQAKLKPLFAAQHGQLNWYCTDYWSRELDLNIAALKREARSRIAWLHDAEIFLRELRRRNKQLILVTNAHQDSLSVKDESTGLGKYFDALITSHRLGYAKEQTQFWQQLAREQHFDPQRTLFVDDSLPVLRAARDYGIRHLVAVTHPDSAQPVRDCAEFPAVARVAQLL